MAGDKIKLVTDQRPFAKIYHDFLYSELLDTSQQKLVYIYLKSFAGESGGCYPSLRKLSVLTKIKETKLRATLKELEEKGVLKIEPRNRADGSRTSNLYTLYDVKEVWQSSDVSEVEQALQQMEEQQMIALLEKRGYSIQKKIEELEQPPERFGGNKRKENKKKRLESVPAKEQNQAPNEKSSSKIKDTTTCTESQVKERYSMDQLKEVFGYEVMIQEAPHLKKNVESILTILHFYLNTTKVTIRVSGEERPREVVISQLMKLNDEIILSVLERFRQNTTPVENVSSYLLTSLYNEVSQFSLKITNQVSVDRTKD